MIFGAPSHPPVTPTDSWWAPFATAPRTSAVEMHGQPMTFADAQAWEQAERLNALTTSAAAHAHPDQPYRPGRRVKP